MGLARLQVLLQYAQTESWVFFTATLFSIALSICLWDYHGWLRLGPGGLPYNVWGWLRQWQLKLSRGRRDTTSITVYQRIEGDTSKETEQKRALTAYLSKLPIRPGPRPKVAHWLIPHRQRSSLPVPAHISNACQAVFEQLATKHAGCTEVRQSVLERRGAGIFLREMDRLPALVSTNRGETAHFHASDCSSHVTLSYRDSIEVIQKGWGERHGLSGDLLPRAYILLYAPEDRTQVDVVSMIMDAAIRYNADIPEPQLK